MHYARRGLSENIYLHHKKKHKIKNYTSTSRASKDMGRPMVPSQNLISHNTARGRRMADGGAAIWTAEIFRFEREGSDAVAS